MLNVVAIMGRLTADPELKTTPNGVSVTSFTLAVDRSYVKQGQDRQADFINVVAWRGTAEFVCKYFTKGQMMAVAGAIQTRNYEDKQGNKRTAVEIVANDVNFCGDKNDGVSSQPQQSPYGHAQVQSQSPAYPESQSYQNNFEEIIGDDDLPF